MKLWKLIAALSFVSVANADAQPVSIQVSRCGAASAGFVPFCVNDGAGAQIPLLSINPSTHKLGMSPSVLTLPSLTVPGILTNNASGVVASSPFPSISISQYGAKCDGTTDDSAAINAALVSAVGSGGVNVTIPQATCVIASAIVMQSNITLRGTGSSSILKMTSPNTHGINMNGVNGGRVSDLRITFAPSAVGDGAYYGAIYLSNAARNVVEDVEIDNYQWAGIYVSANANDNYIHRNYIHDMSTSGVDSNSGDILLLFGPAYNTISENRLNGGTRAWFGVGINQWSAGSPVQYGNKVLNNTVMGTHEAYGIYDYNEVEFGKNHSLIQGNYVSTIRGNVITGNAGACIYIQGAAGDIVTENTVEFCNLETTTASLTPAGIGINNIDFEPVIVSNNTIRNVGRWHGIEVAASHAGATLSGNSIVMIPTTSVGEGIHIANSNNVTTHGNHIDMGDSVADAITVTSSTALFSNFSLTGDIVINAGYSCANVYTTSAGTLSNVSINQMSCGQATGSARNMVGLRLNAGTQIAVSNSNININYAALYLTGAADVKLSGNTFTNNSVQSTETQSGALRVTYVNNSFINNGSGSSFAANGTNTGSFINNTNTMPSGFVNAGSGLHIEQNVSAIPIYQNLQNLVGDTFWNISGVSGQPKGWIVTAAPNTLKSLGVSDLVGVADLRLVAPTSTASATTLGYTTAGDGGGASYRAVVGAAAATYVDNGSTTIVPTGGDGSSAWLLNTTIVVPETFGVVSGLSVTGAAAVANTTAMQAAVNYAASRTYGVVDLHGGKYVIGALTVPEGTTGLKIKNGWIQTYGDVTFLSAATGAVSINFVSVENVFFDASSLTTFGRVLLDSTRMASSKFEDLWFYAAGSNKVIAIYAQGYAGSSANHGVVRHIYGAGLFVGVDLIGSTDVNLAVNAWTISDSHIQPGSGTLGVVVGQNNSSTRIINNTIESPSGGTGISNDGSGTVIEGNHFESVAVGISYGANSFGSLDNSNYFNSIATPRSYVGSSYTKVSIYGDYDSNTGANNPTVAAGQFTASVITTNGTVPTISSCGTGPTIDGTSTSNSGIFTTGAGGTSCVISFAAANYFPIKSFCTMSPASPGATFSYLSGGPYGFNVTGTVANASYSYTCGGH